MADKPKQIRTALSSKASPLSADKRQYRTSQWWNKVELDAYTSENALTRIKAHSILSAERFVYGLGGQIGEGLRQSKRGRTKGEANEIRRDYFLRYAANIIEDNLGVAGGAWAQRIRNNITTIKADNPGKGFEKIKGTFLGIIEHVKDLEKAVIKQADQYEKAFKEADKKIQKMAQLGNSDEVIKIVAQKVDNRLKNIETFISKTPMQIDALKTDISQVKSIVDNNQNSVRGLSREITEINAARANDAAQISQLSSKIKELETMFSSVKIDDKSSSGSPASKKRELPPRDSKGWFTRKINSPQPPALRSAPTLPLALHTSLPEKPKGRRTSKTLTALLSNRLNSGLPFDILGGVLGGALGKGALGGVLGGAALGRIGLGLLGKAGVVGGGLYLADKAGAFDPLKNMTGEADKGEQLHKGTDNQGALENIWKNLMGSNTRDKLAYYKKLRDSKQSLPKSNEQSLIKRPLLKGEDLSNTIDDRIYKDRIDREKSQFMQFGALPSGFEFIKGHRGRLGSADAVAASGAMPLGDYSSDYGNSPYYNGPNSGGINGNPIRSSGGRQGGYGFSGSQSGSGDTRYDSSSGGKQIQIWQKQNMNFGKESEPETHNKVVNVPYNGTEASVRYNNPGASYPSRDDVKFGIEGYGIIGGGHKIGKFPTVMHGAASNFALWDRKYTGKTLQDAVNEWRGGNGSLKVPDGFDPNMKLTKEQLQNKDFMINLFQGMAKHEAGRKTPISPDEWSKAYDLYKAGGINEYHKQNPLLNENGLPILSLPTKEALAQGSNNTTSNIPPMTKITPEIQKERPDYFRGNMKFGEKTYQFGTGAPNATGGPMKGGSVPYGEYNIKPGLHYGANPRFQGNSFRVQDMFDPKWGRERTAILFHSARDLDKMYSAGCFAINPKQWPEFKKQMLEQMQKHGEMVVRVTPDGNGIVYPKSNPPPEYALKDKVTTPTTADNFIGKVENSTSGDSEAKERNVPWTSLENPPTKAEVDEALKNGTKFFDFDQSQASGREIAKYIQEKGGQTVAYQQGLASWSSDYKTSYEQEKAIALDSNAKFIHFDNQDKLSKEQMHDLIKSAEQQGKYIIPKNNTGFWNEYLDKNPAYAKKIPYAIRENLATASDADKEAVKSLDSKIPGGVTVVEWQKGNSGVTPTQAQSNPVPTIHMKGNENPSNGPGGYDSRGSNIYNNTQAKPVEPVKPVESTELPKLELLKPDGSNARPIETPPEPVPEPVKQAEPVSIQNNTDSADASQPVTPKKEESSSGNESRAEKPQSSSESGQQSTAGAYGGGSRHNPETRAPSTGSGGRGAQGRCFI